jgi:autotransporter-associated beta strand protein
VQAGGAMIDDGGFAITIAAVLLHDPALGVTTDGGLTKLDTGTLTLTANETYTGPTLINAGTLALSGSGALAGSTNLYVGFGAIFDASGTTGGSFTLGSGRTLWGNGSINGNFSIGTAAILAPGSNSIGALTFNSALTLAAGSTNIFAVSHLPLTNDAANIAGALTMTGTLIITNSGVNALVAGDSFKLFSASSYNGTFANVILPSLNASLAWNTNALNTAGVISIVSTAPATPPNFGSLSISGSSLIFSGSNGTPSANFYLLTTTNLATPLSNWTRLLTNQFDSSGNFNFTNPAGTNAGSFYRLQLP